MTTKEEYSKKINSLLGTDINFEKLTKEDLVKLDQILSTNELAIRLVRRKAREIGVGQGKLLKKTGLGKLLKQLSE